MLAYCFRRLRFPFTSFLVGRGAFLGRLKKEFDGAPDLATHLAQDFGNAQLTLVNRALSIPRDDLGGTI